MPITATLLTSGNSAVGATSWPTASVTPTANALVIVAVAVRIATSPPTTPTLSGNGLTYVQIADVRFDQIATPLHGLTLFRAMGAAPTAGAITIDFAGVSHQSIAWDVIEFSGVNTGGTNGSAAVVQSATANVDGLLSITTPLAAFADSANNVSFCAAAADNASTWTPDTGFTELSDDVSAVPRTSLETQWRIGQDLSIVATYTITGDAGAIAIEIAAAAVAAAANAGRGLTLLGVG